jgi:hypothetical protein
MKHGPAALYDVICVLVAASAHSCEQQVVKAAAG